MSSNVSDVRRLAIDPKTSTTIYAAGNAVLKSIDGGNSWRATGQLTSNPVASIAIDRVTPTTVYVGTAGGIFKTIDGGDHWKKGSIELGNPNVEGGVAVHPVTPRIVYAGTSAGVLKSIDAGETWNLTGLSDFILALVIDPVTSTTIYAARSRDGGVSIFKSTDAAVTWREAAAGVTATEIRALAIDPITPKIIYAGTDAGVFKSTNGGDDWVAINMGLTAKRVYALALDPFNPAILYAGTNAGVFTTATTDLTPPESSIVSGPAGTIGVNNTTFTWTGSDNVTPLGNLVYAYRLDPVESSFSAFGSATVKSYSNLPNGNYTFSVKAEDQTGNEDQTPATQSFTVNVTAPLIALNFDGQTRDRVGPGEFSQVPDGQLDGVFNATVNAGSGNRVVTRLDLVRNNGDGVWNTNAGDVFWILGAAADEQASLLNAADDTVNFLVSDATTFKIFAADLQNRMFTPGSAFVLTVSFADGTTRR